MSGTATESRDALAQWVVDRLYDDLPVRRKLPQDDPEWSDAFIRAIRTHKEQFRGSRDLRRLLAIAGDLLYGKNIHWALELLQNAEDAGASCVSFVFEADRIVVWNNGRAFTEEDVWGICSAGHSAKRNKIGFFGIGFKSVYKLTAAPEVFSGAYAFRIHDKIYPEPMAATRVQTGARFVLPLLPSERGRLEKSLGRITSDELLRVLLTLRNVKVIRIFDRTGADRSGRFRRRVVASGRDRDELEIAGTWPETPPERWQRYWFETEEVPAGLNREGRDFIPGDRSTIVVARPTDGDRSDFNLHCFLPLDVRSQLRWLVQADFEPTPGRERLRESDWNAWLLSEAGHALSRAVYGEARTGMAPWNLIPLREEVIDEQQQIAADVMLEDLREMNFVRTRRGWRPPSGSTWGNYAELEEIVREADLAAVGLDASYIVDEVLGPIKDDGLVRAERVLGELGASAVDCPAVVRLLERPDGVFGAVRRDAAWWLRMLDVMGRYADQSTLVALGRTACLPVAGGRVRPSPTVATDGYLVAFSRADNLADLRAFFGDSDVYLIELGPRRRDRAAKADPATSAALLRVREMLAAEPFSVAAEAGPYHVVTHLVLPRMRALAQLPHLDPGRIEQLWRLAEYVRQKWPSYVSEYRRWKNDRDSETDVADRLADQLHVVGHAAGPAVSRAVPIRSAYLPTAMLGQDGMDVVLSGERSTHFIDTIHARPLRVPAQRRGGRRRGEVRPPVEFLSFLGAPIGPRVEQVASAVAMAQPIEQRPSDLEWVDWSAIPPGARNRVGLAGDWTSPDLERLEVRWNRLSERSRRLRGRALFGLIQRDWPRLTLTATASAHYFYSSWRPYDDQVPSTWAGRLGRLRWLPSLTNALHRPADLVLNTPQNRAALAGDRELLLRWEPALLEAVLGIGVARRPSPMQLLETLSLLRTGELDASADETTTVARAAYASLAEALREAEGVRRDALVALLAPRFQGNGRRGLIFAPLAQGGSGEEWWPTTRVIQSDESEVVGPFLGQLGTRYRQAGGLWDTLGVRKALTPDLIAQLISRDLPGHDDQPEAFEYYGRLVGFLDGRPGLDGHDPPDVALSTNGWVPAAVCRWTSRPEVLAAYPLLPWWTPGGRDPSTLRAAGSWLGIREIGTGPGSGLRERWTIDSTDGIELGLEERWLAAIEVWPAALVASAILDGAAGAQLAGRTRQLRPRISARVHGALQLDDYGTPLRASIEPRALLRPADNSLVAASSDDLFSSHAAEAMATLVTERRLQAANTLASLLAAALHAPDDLERQVLRYAATSAQFRGFTYELPADQPDLDLDGEIPSSGPATRHRQRPGKDSEVRDGQLLADPNAYRLAGVIASGGDGVAPAAEAAPKPLKRPVDQHQSDGGDSEDDSDREAPEPRRRYSNTEIETAARPFVEQFEVDRGCTITRQPALVGADYRATDGRYIEVKAFGEEAPGSFDLEPAEWRAAQHPQIGPDYWVYIVDHLRDGKPPRVTAVLNPVLDGQITKQPTGKLRVRGWRSARTKYEGLFEVAAGAPDEER